MNKELINKAKAGDSNAQFEIGNIFYNEGDYINAVKYFQMGKDNNSIEAEIALAVCQMLGKGIEKNQQEAHQVFEKYANMGYERAQYNLAEDYYFGTGVEKNYKKAFDLYLSLAENGYAKAQKRIGEFYYYGEFIDKNPNEAKKWFEKAVEQKLNSAIQSLGIYYLEIEKNIEKAIELFDIVKYKKGIEDSYTILGKEVSNYSQENIEKLYTHAYNYNYPSVLNMVSEYYEKGIGIQSNIDIAKKYRDKALNNENIINKIKEYYDKSKLDSLFDDEIDNLDELIDLAYNQNDMNAQLKLAKYYNDKNQLLKAFNLYKNVADQGNLDSCLIVAYYYYNGIDIGLTIDYDKAIEYYNKSIK